jgi:hypothetical protein
MSAVRGTTRGYLHTHDGFGQLLGVARGIRALGIVPSSSLGASSTYLWWLKEFAKLLVLRSKGV